MRGLQERRDLVAALTRRAGLIAALAALAVALDQLTKTLAISGLAPGGRFACDQSGLFGHHVLGPLWLVLSCNAGAAFSLGQGVTPVVEVLAVVLVAGLVVAGGRAAGRLQAAAIGLMLGGAVSNLVDRLARGNGGAVVDFFDAVRIGTRDWWPTFNVADSAIVVGAAALALTWSRHRSA